MNSILLIGAAIGMLLLAIYLILRTRVIKRSHEFLASYGTMNILDEISKKQNGAYIPFQNRKEVTQNFKEISTEAEKICEAQNHLLISPISQICVLSENLKHIDDIIHSYNENILSQTMYEYEIFFDTCLTYPLDRQQRRSIVSEEDNCLVISSAGSGKTSSIVGKVKYLTEIKGIAPEKILLISYTNKAAAELTERIGNKALRGYTFHKLAMDLIGEITGEKPSICDNTDALFMRIYHELLNTDEKFKKNIIKYFIELEHPEETDEEKSIQEQREKLKEAKSSRIKAIVPDMDGQPVYVKSLQESRICYHLAALGIPFRYEEPYERPVADEMHSQYRPDFSLYILKKDGTRKRIYLEHFGINESGTVPLWFANDQGLTYEEANQKYGDGIIWKRKTHEKFGTTLLETTSADFQNTDIRSKLESMLLQEGAVLNKKSTDELYSLVIQEGSKQEKGFIRMIATFINLMKSGCHDLQNLMDKAQRQNDKRNHFLLQCIIQPMYKNYTATLLKSGQIDFTDLIIQATAICKRTSQIHYDYIIVDEFQDISLDRYEFLKVLRQGNPPAKLYCVGDDWQSIYRFSGSDMALFNQFPKFFGPTDTCKIETTYRFGQPAVAISSSFIQKNSAQLKKDIHPFNPDARTEIRFKSYDNKQYCETISYLVNSIPKDKSIFLLGRYSFDDNYLSSIFNSKRIGNKYYYDICGRELEFLTVHKSKGLEADYVILLQCNRDTYGFPSMINDDPIMKYVLTQEDSFPYGEERRLFYVATTRAKICTYVLYDYRTPSVFVQEFLHPEEMTKESYLPHPNANKHWSQKADAFLSQLYKEGKTIQYIAMKMGRSQTSISMRLNKLGLK